MVVCHWIPLCNVVSMQQMNKIELAVLWNGAGKYIHTNLHFFVGINIHTLMLIMIVLQKMMLLANQTICLKDSHTNFQIDVGISILYFWGTLQFVCKNSRWKYQIYLFKIWSYKFVFVHRNLYKILLKVTMFVCQKWCCQWHKLAVWMIVIQISKLM